MRHAWLLGALAACGSSPAAPPPPDAAPPDAPPSAYPCDDDDVEGSWRAVPGVTTITAADCGDFVAGARCFDVTFAQPIHHDRPSPTFEQHLQLVHRGCGEPMVIADWGYAGFPVFYEAELSSLWGTNALNVEHRFQGNSVPADPDWDWTALTIANGAADQHALIRELRQLYGAPWISTGASKGGVTALYHHYLHPDDLDGTVPYVAPASLGREDGAYQGYLAATLPACAQAVRDVQVAALTTRRAAGIAAFEPDWGDAAEITLEQYVWFADWGFWQYGGVGACGEVPTAETSDAAFFAYLRNLVEVGPRALPGQDARSDFALNYEWLTEQGFADQINAEVRALLTFPAYSMAADFEANLPEVPLPAYDGSVTAAMRAWAPTAPATVLLYGEYDPWSGGAVDAPTEAGSALFVVPAANHGAGLEGLPPAEFAAATALISDMLGRAPQTRAIHRAPRGMDQLRAHLAAAEARTRRFIRR